MDRTEPAATAIQVFSLRGQPVILAARAAAAFGVETRIVVQAITRNPEKFPDRYAFQVTAAERADLTSRGVISSGGHGGARALPWVVTQKGAIRLATVLRAPKALEATDLFIDVFAAVAAQALAGRNALSLPPEVQPGGAAQAAAQTARLRARLARAMEDLLDTVIDRTDRVTVRDALAETTAEAIGSLQAVLRRPQVANDKVAAETLKLLEEVRDMRERRAADLDAAALAREARALDNLERRIGIVREIAGMLDRMEPNAMLGLIAGFAAPPALPPPEGKP